MGLTYDENTRSMFVNNLKAKMAEYNLETVYLASPPNVSSPLIISCRARGQMRMNRTRVEELTRRGGLLR